MKLSNDIKVYCKSMGKVFEVEHIAKTENEANKFMKNHNDCGVIAEDKKLGLIFIANFYSISLEPKH